MGEGMMRWGFDPWEEFSEMRRRMNDLFWLVPAKAEKTMKEWRGEWFPALDVKETAKEIVITAELPGLREEDVEINVASDYVELKGERKEDKEIEDKARGYYRKERSYGKFYRNVPLPAEVIPDKTEASFQQGVLEIKLLKAKEGKGHPVKVKIKKKEELQ